MKQKFNKRAFVSVTLLLSFLTLPISGIMCHILQLEELTPQRHFWMSIHNGTGILFIIMLLFHTIYNIRTMKNHIKKRFSKEVLLGVLLFMTVIGLMSMHSY